MPGPAVVALATVGAAVVDTAVFATTVGLVAGTVFWVPTDPAGPTFGTPAVAVVAAVPGFRTVVTKVAFLGGPTNPLLLILVALLPADLMVTCVLFDGFTRVFTITPLVGFVVEAPTGGRMVVPVAFGRTCDACKAGFVCATGL